MTDQGGQWQQPRKYISPSKFPAILFITSSFVLSWVIIGFITWYGNPTNTLHTSVQSWCFVIILATLAGFGLDSVTQILAARDAK